MINSLLIDDRTLCRCQSRKNTISGAKKQKRMTDIPRTYSLPHSLSFILSSVFILSLVQYSFSPKFLKQDSKVRSYRIKPKSSTFLLSFTDSHCIPLSFSPFCLFISFLLQPRHLVIQFLTSAISMMIIMMIKIMIKIYIFKYLSLENYLKLLVNMLTIMRCLLVSL